MDGLWLYETKRAASPVWVSYRYQRATPEQWRIIADGGRISELERETRVMDQCDICGNRGGTLSGLIDIKGKAYCRACGQDLMTKVTDKILATTTMNIDGYRIVKYIDIESVEIVLGTGFFSEFSSDIDDFFGLRSTGFEKKLQHAKKNAFQLLKLRAYEKDANAIVGVDIDYTEFSSNRIGLVANGTLVKIEPIENRQ